ncbi:MAG: formate--tetrahydrofolate ligase [Planctomycetota bacterium]
MPSDIEIARQTPLQPITEVAERLGLGEEDLICFGRDKAKLPLHLQDENRIESSNLILVTAISPTPAGEGKTTVSIGLAQGLTRIGKQTTVALREPSLGPVFGIKGGATGGGYSQVLPMEDINLHFTGDFSAVEKAHNLLAALVDNNLQNSKRSLNMDGRKVFWKRVFDMNDRALRKVTIGLGGTSGGIPRETGFDITAASEIMAILCLSSGLSDLKERLGNILVGMTRGDEPVFAKDLNAHGAMATLLKDAIQPNLVQTIEGTPAIIHGGPFANIAQGTNSVIATRTAMSLSDYVVTEAGFGSDLGAEKFFNIKCASAGLRPKAMVLVATVRALKYHGGASLNELNQPDLETLQRGLANLEKHLENSRLYNINAVVAINRFLSDSDEELALIKNHCERLGFDAVVADVWGKGGEGAETLAEMVVAAIDQGGGEFAPLYGGDSTIEEKIELICRKVYGASGVDYTSKARQDLGKVCKLGFEHFSVCIAKTQKSLSDDPTKIGRPTSFRIQIREVEIAAGAGFVVPITGEMMRMPGLPATPAAEKIDIDETGVVSGLF